MPVFSMKNYGGARITSLTVVNEKLNGPDKEVVCNLTCYFNFGQSNWKRIHLIILSVIESTSIFYKWDVTMCSLL